MKRVKSSVQYGLACGLVLGVSPLGAPAVLAEQVAAEVFQLDGIAVTVLPHAFLSEEELMTLRLVGQNRDALAVFIPEGSGFAALAVAPEEGFVRGGMPVESASAISGLPDLASARDTALAECNAVRNGGQTCEIVLEVAPN